MNSAHESWDGVRRTAGQLVGTPERRLRITGAAIQSWSYVDKYLLPACTADEVWDALQKLPNWETVAPNYQGTFSLGSQAYVAAQIDLNGVTFTLGFGDGFWRDEDDLAALERHIENYRTILEWHRLVIERTPTANLHSNSTQPDAPAQGESDD